MKKIADLGIPVISDEIYHGLVYGDKEHSILEFFWRRSVSRNPIHFFPIRSQKQKKRSALDVEFLEQFLA